MRFEKELVHGRLIKRYKRFLSDIELDSGEIVVAHCTNSGSMKSCLEDGAEVYLSPVDDPKRKTQFTWEMIKINNDWVGINTGIPNKLVYEAILKGLISGFDQYTKVQREVIFDDSRFDVFAENKNEKCFIEVKNVTMKEEQYALFPDAITIRGQKHLKTLMKAKQQGMRAAMLYIIQRSDVSKFGPAKEIDSAYANLLKEAWMAGVEILPMQAKVTPTEIKLVKKLPFEL